MASRGYVILEWNFNNRDLENAVSCPTPEAMKDELLSDLSGYLQYKCTLCEWELTDEEWDQIQDQVEKMSDSIQ